MAFELHCPDSCPFIQRGEKNPVLPDGNKDGFLIFGEAPGKTEVEKGHGFAGIAGRNLWKAFLDCGYTLTTDHKIFTKQQNGFIEPIATYARANACLCNPTKTIRTGERYGDEKTTNRKPTKAEISACSQNLHNAIDYFEPKVIIAVGKSAFDALGYSSKPMGFIEFCRFGLPYLEVKKPMVILIPHTSPYSWNMSTKDGVKYSDIGINNIRIALEYFK